MIREAINAKGKSKPRKKRGVWPGRKEQLCDCEVTYFMFNKGPQDQKYSLVAEHLPSTCEARVQIPGDTEMDIVEWMLLLASRVVHACNLTS